MAANHPPNNRAISDPTIKAKYIKANPNPIKNPFFLMDPVDLYPILR